MKFYTLMGLIIWDIISIYTIYIIKEYIKIYNIKLELRKLIFIIMIIGLCLLLLWLPLSLCALAIYYVNFCFGPKNRFSLKELILSFM